MKLSQAYLWRNPFSQETPSARLLAAWTAIPLLEGIPRRVVEKLVARTHVRQYQPGEYLFREGDSAVAAGLIIEGNVVIRSSGSDDIIVRLGPGDFFGEAALLEDTPRSASGIAETPTQVSLLVRYQLEEFVRHRPQAGLGIMTNLARLLLARLHCVNTGRTSQ